MIENEKTIRFDRANNISYEDTEYVDEFRTLLENHRSIYTKERISETKGVLEELIEMADHRRTIHKLRLELDDAGRSVCRSHGIQFPHYAKMSGILGRNGFLAADNQNRTEEMHTMSQESFYGKLYRGIVDIDNGVDEISENPDTRTVVEDGLDLLAHLYRQQMNPGFVSDEA